MIVALLLGGGLALSVILFGSGGPGTTYSDIFLGVMMFASPPVIIGVLLWLSSKYYNAQFYLRTLVISSFVALVAVLFLVYLGTLYTQFLNKESQDKKVLMTPTPTNFVCSGLPTRALSILNGDSVEETMYEGHLTGGSFYGKIKEGKFVSVFPPTEQVIAETINCRNSEGKTFAEVYPLAE